MKGSRADEFGQWFAEQGIYSEIPYAEHALVDFRPGPAAPRKVRLDSLYVSFNVKYTETVLRCSGRSSKTVRLAP